MRMNIRCRIVVSSLLLFTWSCSGVGDQSRLVQIQTGMYPLGSCQAMAYHQGAILNEFCLESPRTSVEVRLWWEIETDGHTIESKPIICQSKDATAGIVHHQRRHRNDRSAGKSPRNCAGLVRQLFVPKCSQERSNVRTRPGYLQRHRRDI